VQQRLIKSFPKHDKRADAMLSLARVQARLKQNAAARETLDQLIAQYPKSKAAGTGRKLRAILD
jgi:TolA-binding protein